MLIKKKSAKVSNLSYCMALILDCDWTNDGEIGTSRGVLSKANVKLDSQSNYRLPGKRQFKAEHYTQLLESGIVF